MSLFNLTLTFIFWWCVWPSVVQLGLFLWRLTQLFRQNLASSENVICLIGRDHLRWVFEENEFFNDGTLPLWEPVLPNFEMYLCPLQFGVMYYEDDLQHLPCILIPQNVQLFKYFYHDQFFEIFLNCLTVA